MNSFALNRRLSTGVSFQCLKSVLLLIGLTCLLGKNSGFAQQRGRELDQSIIRTIEQNLVLDGRVRPDQVQVRSEDGVVTLTGKAETLRAKHAAAALASSVVGVREVDNQIELADVQMNSTQLRKVLLMKLAGEPGADVFDMQVEVEGGRVTLTGTVDTWAERRRAVETAKDVPGVTGVVNGLSVRRSVQQSDSALIGAIERRIESDSRLRPEDLQVSAQDGSVHLAGRVSDIRAKMAVLSHAWAAGAQAVNGSSLLIEREGRFRRAAADSSWQSPGLGAEPGSLQDEQIAEAVRQALWRDRRTDSGTTQVTVQDGEVRLSGIAATLFARERAVDLANAVRGVSGVYDDLRLQENPRSDQALLDEILSDLAEDPVTQSQRLRVVVHNGVVQMTGQVRSWPQRQAAENVVKRVPGVHEVQNQLIVEAVATRPDTEVAADIRSSLRSDPRLADNSVRVEVRNGRVTLRGVVGSELEKRMAIAGAQILNVRSIDASELRVIPNRAARQWPEEGRPSDRELQSSVLELLRRHPWLSPSDVSVTVNDGVVTLSGRVDDSDSKWAATREASRVAGVKHVRNSLNVGAPRSSDAQVSSQVERAFELDPYLDSDDVQATMDKGTAIPWQIHEAGLRLERLEVTKRRALRRFSSSI